MSADSIEKLYKNYGILADAKDKITEVSFYKILTTEIPGDEFYIEIIIYLHFSFQHEKEYLEIIEAVKGSDKEKRLASQFIAKFFKHFPNLADQAIEAHLDLCEDDDIAVNTMH